MFEKNQLELIKEIEESEERDNEETDSLQDGRLSQLVSDSPDLRRLRKRIMKKLTWRKKMKQLPPLQDGRSSQLVSVFLKALLKKRVNKCN